MPHLGELARGRTVAAAAITRREIRGFVVVVLALVVAAAACGSYTSDATTTTTVSSLDAWTRIDLDPATFGHGSHVYDATVRDGRIVAVGGDSTGTAAIWTSADGKTWTRRSLPEPGPASALREVAATDARLLAVGWPFGSADSGRVSTAWTSADGDQWQQTALPPLQPYVYTLGATRETFVAFGFGEDDSAHLWTGDGDGTWIERRAGLDSASGRSINDFLITPHLVVAIGHQNEFGGTLVLTSSDGAEWRQSSVDDGAGDPEPAAEVATVFKGSFVAIGRTSYGHTPGLGVWSSKDAQSWERSPSDVTLPEGVLIQDAVATSQVVAALARPPLCCTPAVVMSTDGTTWHRIALEPPVFGTELELTTMIAYGDQLLLFGRDSGGPAIWRWPSTTQGVGDDAATTTSTAEPGPLPAGDASVQGRVTAGPTCPVERADQPCPPEPVHGRVEATDSTGAIAGSAATDDTGRYAIALPAGDYTLHVVTGGPFPRCPVTHVTLAVGSPTTADIGCDTGIR